MRRDDVHLNLDSWMAEALRAIARAEDRTLANLIKRVIRLWLEERGITMSQVEDGKRSAE